MTIKGFASSVVAALLLSSLTLISSCASAPKPAPESSDTSRVIEGFSSPESVMLTADGMRVFVSNVGEKLAPNTKDGDGYISELAPDGRVVKKMFAPVAGEKLDAPKGMAIAGDTLYVADIDRVAGLSLATGAQTSSIDMSITGTVFLNDIAVIDDKTLFVSATDIGKIYKITLGENPEVVEVASEINGPNGLYYDATARKLYVAEYGTKGKGGLGVLDLSASPYAYERLGGPEGALDGISMISNDRILYSDWVEFGKPGAFHVFDIKPRTFYDMKLTHDIKGPADFRYDEKTNTIYVPMMVEGKVLIEKLK